jgi:S-formylglutathione hydrolase FrmB
LVRLLGCTVHEGFSSANSASPSAVTLDRSTEKGTSAKELPAQAGAWIDTAVTYLGETHEVLVYLPATYPLQAPHPVVYLLHGHGQSPSWWKRSDVQGQADTNNLVLVAVEGDTGDIIASWYSRQADLPWPDGPDWGVSFYEWFFEGVLPWVESTYDVRTDPGGRAIAGFSMGGKGALSLAGYRPDLFSAAAAIAGVMDLRDYSAWFEISDVYGPLAGNEIVYASDSPVYLAPNLKGLSVTLLHGAEDGLVSREQSRKMSRALADLGYPHRWEEIPGQDHEPVSTYEITRTFERIAEALEAPYNPPTAWRYRFADDRMRQVYGTTITKTDLLTWTEVMSVTSLGFDADSGDAFSIATASLYAPLSPHTVTVDDLSREMGTVRVVTATHDGRLLLSLPAGRFRVTIDAVDRPERESAPSSSRWVALPDLVPTIVSDHIRQAGQVSGPVLWGICVRTLCIVIGPDPPAE